MSDQKMREEFEQAFAHETVRRAISDGLLDGPEEPAELLGCTVFILARGRKGDTYEEPHFASAWWAWQASRAALVIELPDPGDAFVDVRKFTINQCRHAIEAAGVKVKP